MKVVEESDTILGFAFDEVDQFLNENSWLNEIQKFCLTWDVHSTFKWERAQAYHIEVSSLVS